MRPRSLSPTLVYFGAFILLGLVTSANGPALPEFARQTATPLSRASLLFSSTAAGHLFGGALVARFYDRTPGHRVMAIALLILSGSLFVASRLPWLWALAAVFFVNGVAKSTLEAGGNTLMMWVYNQRAAPYLNILHFCFGIGAFLSPILVTQTVAHTGSIQWAYGVLALCALPLAWWCANLPSPTVPASSASSEHKPAASLNLVLVGLFSLLFVYVGTEVSFGGWIFVYATKSHLCNLESGGYLAASFWGALTLSRLASTAVVARLEPPAILVGSLVIALLSSGIMAVWATTVMVWVGTIGMGIGMANIYPTVIVLARNHMAITGRIMGYLGVAGSLGVMVMPWLIGQLFVAVGPEVFLWFSLGGLGLALVIVILVMCFMRRPR